MKWQPIETAPKDIEVLIWTGENIYVGKYVQNIETGETSFSVLEFEDGSRVVANPTHWMYLPEPPTEPRK